MESNDGDVSGDLKALMRHQLDYDEKQTLSLNVARKVTTGKYGGVEFPGCGLQKKIGATRPIPTPILAELDNVRKKTFVGLLPVINRVFVTIDEKIYLWNYHSRDDYNEFAVFSGLSQVIVSVALVKPKPSVFVKEIEFLLVLATPVEVVMVGVEFERVNGRRNVQNRIRLHPTQMAVPTDDIQMLKIVGTDDGRILMGGKDGNIYEFLYQAQEGWLTKRCRKISHTSSRLRMLLPTFLPWSTQDDPLVDMLVDSDRRYVYTLSFSNALRVFSIGEDEQALTLLATYPGLQLSQDIQSKIVNNRKPLQIVSLAIVSEDESQTVCLMAITKRGDRAYFSLTNNFTGKRINLEFVRAPPSRWSDAPHSRWSDNKEQPSRNGISPGHSKTSLENVRLALYRDGVLVLAEGRDKGDQLASYLVGILSDTSGRMSSDTKVGEQESKTKMFETVEKIEIENELVTAIAEVNQEMYMNTSAISPILHARNKAKPLVGLSELCVQHALPNRQFLVLSGSGLSTYIKRRPLDELIDLLQRRDNQQLHDFFIRYTFTEVCAMCLVVACYPIAYRLCLRDESKFQHDDEVASTSHYPQETDVLRHNPELKMMAKEYFFQFGNEELIAKGRARHQPATAKIAGLALYTSRLLRPVWDWSICYRQGTDPTNLRLRFRKSQLIALRDCLLPLKAFLEKHHVPFRTSFTPNAFFNQPNLAAERERYQDLVEKENKLFQQLRVLIYKCIESFELLIALAADDINFLKIIAKLKPEDISSLQKFKFLDLVTSGQHLAQQLVAALMAIKQAPATEGGAETGDGKQWVVDLQRSCPEFVGESQVCLYRGNDHINRLIKDNTRAVRRKGVLPETVKRKELHEALLQFKTAARNFTFDVESVCDKLRSVLFFPGIVDLCLHRAHLLGTGEIRMAGQNNQEVAEFMAEEQERCYRCILRNFGILIDWPRGQNEENDFTMDQQQKKIVEVQMLQRCLSSSNKHFHWRLYEWFQKNRKDLLLQITSPYLLEYLTSNDTPEHMELLKEYYIKHNMFRNAAVLLKELAIKETHDYDLNQRMNFLIRALACAKHCVDAERPSEQMDPYEINQIRDRLELCQIQTDIATAMQRAQLPEEQSQQLEHRLYDIDELYNKFAMQHKLWENCLQIFHFEGSAVQRSDFIQNIWSNIIRSEIQVDLEMFKQQAPRSPRNSSFLQPSPWRKRVEKTMLRLYQKYQDESILFPLEHIIRELESNNFKFKHGATDRFVVDCLLQANINLLDVLRAYESLIDRSMAQTEFTRAMKSRVAQSVIHLQTRVKTDVASGQLSRSEELALREAARNLASACLREMRAADLQDTTEAQQLQGCFS